jgi:diguanylate cyclase (GGDEF)-like protein
MDFEQIQSELRTASLSIESLKQKLGALFSALPDPFFIMDSNGNYLEILGGNAHQFYSDGSFLKAKNINDVFNPKLCELFILTITKAIKTKELQIVEYEITPEHLLNNHDIEPNWFQGRVTLINSLDNETEAVIWNAINITEKKKLENQLRELSDRDPLTGLYNRRYFENQISNYFSQYKRYKEVFSLAFIDIDYFKQVNDKYGHDTGDEVLKCLAELVLSQLRINDLFARFGGEEFILLLPHTPLPQALNILERIRNTIKSFSLETGLGDVTFTVSAGLTEIAENDQDFSVLIKRADSALYVAKNNGRDQITVS